ncbi:hypothetical protein [Woodsholea maritima]|uniref:hypothetical protein n=1 Tax=Woodsholea maritima TaxID=240237 RepID=UPI00037FDAB5|nr:hypothetical protein [Woodsholea maritima]
MMMSMLAHMLVSASLTSSPFAFGHSVDALEAHFNQVCTQWEVRRFDPPQVPFAQESHQQVDCQGYDFAQSPRLAEFVFVDGGLAFVWILVEGEELPQLAQELSQEWGAPRFDNAMFAAFPQGAVALRRDVPEVLYYSPDYAPMFEGWFAQNG